MTQYFSSSLNISLAIIGLWALIGLGGLVRPTSLLFVGRVLSPLAGLFGVVLAVAPLSPHDPSWQNWPALEHAIIVPDFPLINKSFNLSYSGHDL